MFNTVNAFTPDKTMSHASALSEKLCGEAAYVLHRIVSLRFNPVF